MNWMKFLLVGVMATALTTTVTLAKQKAGSEPKKTERTQPKDVTVAGSIAEVKDAKGKTGYSLSGDNGNTYTLKGHETDLAAFKDKRAQITGKETEKDGVKLIKVESVKEAPAKT